MPRRHSATVMPRSLQFSANLSASAGLTYVVSLIFRLSIRASFGRVILMSFRCVRHVDFPVFAVHRVKVSYPIILSNINRQLFSTCIPPFVYAGLRVILICLPSPIESHVSFSVVRNAALSFVACRFLIAVIFSRSSVPYALCL